MAHVSAAGDLALHGVRVLGLPTTARVAGRHRLDAGPLGELPPDFEARGWVRFLGFGGTTGWALADAGRRACSRRSAFRAARDA